MNKRVADLQEKHKIICTISNFCQLPELSPDTAAADERQNVGGCSVFTNAISQRCTPIVARQVIFLCWLCCMHADVTANRDTHTAASARNCSTVSQRSLKVSTSAEWKQRERDSRFCCFIHHSWWQLALGRHMIYRWRYGCRSLGCVCMTESLTTSSKPGFPQGKKSRTDERVAYLWFTVTLGWNVDLQMFEWRNSASLCQMIGRSRSISLTGRVHDCAEPIAVWF